MRNAVLTVSSLAALLLAGCAARTPFCKDQHEVFPTDPFRLAVQPESASIAIGAKMTLSYELTNISDHAVAACAEGWDDHHFIGHSGQNRGTATTNNDGVALDSVIRLAPGSALRWSREVVVPDVGTGPASVVGIFRSNCWLWQGTVKSQPAAVVLVAKP